MREFLYLIRYISVLCHKGGQWEKPIIFAGSRFGKILEETLSRGRLFDRFYVVKIFVKQRLSEQRPKGHCL